MTNTEIIFAAVMIAVLLIIAIMQMRQSRKIANEQKEEKIKERILELEIDIIKIMNETEIEKSHLKRHKKLSVDEWNKDYLRDAEWRTGNYESIALLTENENFGVSQLSSGLLENIKEYWNIYEEWIKLERKSLGQSAELDGSENQYRKHFEELAMGIKGY